jgi:hypothetical protein
MGNKRIFLVKDHSKEKLTIQEILEKNLLRWVISNKQPFIVIELITFQQIFKDIPGISLSNIYLSLYPLATSYGRF